MLLTEPKSQGEVGFAELREASNGPFLQGSLLQGAGLQLREPGWTPAWGMCQF